MILLRDPIGIQFEIHPGTPLEVLLEITSGLLLRISPMESLRVPLKILPGILPGILSRVLLGIPSGGS